MWWRPDPRAALIALGILAPSRAVAETVWGAVPSLFLSERHDDNLFSRPDAQEADWITGLEPGLLLTASRPRWSVEARYTQQAERYADHPGLDTWSARREAGFRWQSRATRTLEATVTASYLETAAAGQLYTASGLDFGRIPARRLQLTPAVAQRLDASDTLLADIAATRDEIPGLATLDSAIAGLRLDHRLSPRTSISIRGQARFYEPGEGASSTSQLVALGCRQSVGRGLELSLDAGPSFSEGRLGAEWLGSLHSRGRRWEWAIESAQGETPVVGAATTVITRRLGASLSGSAGALRGRVALDLVRNRGGVDAEAVQASAEANLRLAEPLAVTLGTAWSRQRGGSLALAPGDLRHLVTELRFVFQPTRRRGVDGDVR